MLENQSAKARDLAENKRFDETGVTLPKLKEMSTGKPILSEELLFCRDKTSDLEPEKKPTPIVPKLDLTREQALRGKEIVSCYYRKIDEANDLYTDAVIDKYYGSGASQEMKKEITRAREKLIESSSKISAKEVPLLADIDAIKAEMLRWVENDPNGRESSPEVVGRYMEKIGGILGKMKLEPKALPALEGIKTGFTKADVERVILDLRVHAIQHKHYETVAASYAITGKLGKGGDLEFSDQIPEVHRKWMKTNVTKESRDRDIRLHAKPFTELHFADLAMCGCLGQPNYEGSWFPYHSKKINPVNPEGTISPEVTEFIKDLGQERAQKKRDEAIAMLADWRNEAAGKGLKDKDAIESFLHDKMRDKFKQQFEQCFPNWSSRAQVVLDNKALNDAAKKHQEATALVWAKSKKFGNDWLKVDHPDYDKKIHDVVIAGNHKITAAQDEANAELAKIQLQLTPKGLIKIP